MNLTIIRGLIINMILLMLFTLVMMNNKVIFCEEIIIPPEILEETKKIIEESLINLVNQEAFRIKYGGGPLFNFCYFTQVYISEFINDLPLNEIIYKYRFESTDFIANNILDLFLQDISYKKQIFGEKLKLAGNIIFMGNYFKLSLELDIILNALTVFFDQHPEATENIGIVTDGYFNMSLELIKQKNILVEKLDPMPFGVSITLEGSSNYIDIYFRYYLKTGNIITSVQIPCHIEAFQSKIPS
jgi:hypothetical protein